MIDQKETSMQDEQTLEKYIIDEIISVLANNDITVNEAERILCHTRDRIKEQKVKLP